MWIQCCIMLLQSKKYTTRRYGVSFSMEMRKSCCWNQATPEKISMSVWFYRKFRNWTQPLGSAQGLEMTARALSGIQQRSSSFSYCSSPTWCYTTTAWVGSSWPHLIWICPSWSLDLCCGQGKRFPAVPGNGNKDQISQPAIIGAETGPKFALCSSALAMLSVGWMGGCWI